MSTGSRAACARDGSAHPNTAATTTAHPDDKLKTSRNGITCAFHSQLRHGQAESGAVRNRQIGDVENAAGPKHQWRIRHIVLKEPGAERALLRQQRSTGVAR